MAERNWELHKYLANTSSNTVFYNSIMWGNIAGNGQGNNIRNVITNARPTFSYSIIEGSGGSAEQQWNDAFGIDGGGNLDADPLFSVSV